MSVVENIAGSFERAFLFGAFLDSLSAPTPTQLWLEQAVAELERQRDADGARKQRKDQIVLRLLKRDGADCWFCGGALAEDISVEHLQPLALGGSWADSNLALAHRVCNRAAGHLSRIKKEALREERLSQEQPREPALPNKRAGRNS